MSSTAPPINKEQQQQRVYGWCKFIRNLFEMASCEENGNAIGFSPEGDVLEIRDITLLSSQILPKYFNHSNVSSLTRQLNNYGFKTTAPRPMSNVTQSFVHEKFMRGRLDLLEGIKRRNTRQSNSSHQSNQSSSSDEDNSHRSSNNHKKARGSTAENDNRDNFDLRVAYDQVRTENESLLEENEVLKRENKLLQNNMRILQGILQANSSHIEPLEFRREEPSISTPYSNMQQTPQLDEGDIQKLCRALMRSSMDDM